ncbi:MAG TPA: insulinase family protein, partial [Candidatus Sphingobacterium stercoripullorum]|nr:insulinase family protein [Candidatus Sphingobacterium stercoripullorum]
MNFSNLLKVSLIASGLSLPFLSIDVQAGNLENPNGITIVAENDSVAQLQDVLPLDDGVIHGKLENGLTYYIRQNKEPKDRVTMYLAIKVGSILESEPQRGLAHFLEHMNFNGLKHFPKNELVNYLQSAGVRFGSDLNAYTSFDETVYQLPIPSDDPELLKNGLQVIRDWAQDA